MKNGLANLSDSRVVRWLGRNREGSPTHKVPSPKKRRQLQLSGRIFTNTEKKIAHSISLSLLAFYAIAIRQRAQTQSGTHAYGPAISSSTLLTPASSPGALSIVCTEYPMDWAQRMYIRSSISVLSRAFVELECGIGCKQVTRVESVRISKC